MKHILLTNDDGIDANGIFALYKELKKLGDVTVARRLRVEAKHPTAWILRAEPITHDVRPHPARRPKLRHLFE